MNRALLRFMAPFDSPYSKIKDKKARKGSLKTTQWITSVDPKPYLYHVSADHSALALKVAAHLEFAADLEKDMFSNPVAEH